MSRTRKDRGYKGSFEPWYRASRFYSRGIPKWLRRLGSGMERAKVRDDLQRGVEPLPDYGVRSEIIWKWY